MWGWLWREGVPGGTDSANLLNDPSRLGIKHAAQAQVVNDTSEEFFLGILIELNKQSIDLRI